MDESTVPELTGYQRLAADLRAAADLFDKAADVPLDISPWIHLDIQPGGDDEQVIDRTDRLGAALFGKPGEAKRMRDGTYHYDVEGMVGMVRVHVFDGIAEATVKERERQAELAAKEAELERLRAEVEKLRSTARPHDRYSALIPDPHPLANCGPLVLSLAPGESCPTCGTVPAADPALAKNGAAR